ncbi:sulfotransferase family 2 domain-containing protein [Tamlana fucoidanivorans]|uniref:Sulfotransferase family protein n=1 Tax=Allotamlana fucoidanivorans TaxID=2583814 RepID=A0A5C4SQP8_9FLAO|nr:sulfotransferase family 2 domain-containing protein [Tamlana fucoidanivorans]TNJ45776.1 sulfotransferase family protein [Tamlana fucoidanivorans]
MISHKHKCIFIHIPKTAGTSINSFFHPGVKFHFDNADYERLFGWCSKRQLHMQHATAKQLLETELVTQEQWDSYFKFTFVRNPWDRSYSDYQWIQEFTKIKGSFKDYIRGKGVFKDIFNNKSKSSYLGDHLLTQTSFFDFEGKFKPNFVGRFEDFQSDIKTVLKELHIEEDFNIFTNKSKRKNDYSIFYTKTKKKMVDDRYEKDIKLLDYDFIDGKSGLQKLKNFV